ncbi:Sec-independent protein translocase protein TatB [Rhodanobacter sp. 115]|uniref:Sec-independent protein translocase protein TatB n=1 Tax=Rhodanobacter sp. FW021-MT20 TaxID=1162282 RepID=UPI000260DFB2|nr:Sec-independent protein translocase protein TatB [Rhodanobacter sp. 115]EIL86872.1 twin arginine-targeting protein translocase TatB [Rhodanobacter sp. 115]
MIDFSLGKLLLIALIALIVLGPEKLPGAARTAGAMLRRVRSGWDSVRAEVERELQLEEIKRAAREVAAQGSAAKGTVDNVIHDVREPVQAVMAGLEQSVTLGGDAVEKTAAEVATTLPSAPDAVVPAAKHVENRS